MWIVCVVLGAPTIPQMNLHNPKLPPEYVQQTIMQNRVIVTATTIVTAVFLSWIILSMRRSGLTIRHATIVSCGLCWAEWQIWVLFSVVV